MTIYNLWIFDEKGTLLFYREWLRKKHTSMGREQEAKLLYGMLFSIKSFVNMLSPGDFQEGFQSFRTSQYRFNLYETPTKVKFVLNTDTALTHPVVRDLLKKLHSQVYVEFVVKNPLYQQGTPIESQLFTTELDEFVQTFAFFK